MSSIWAPAAETRAAGSSPAAHPQEIPGKSGQHHGAVSLTAFPRLQALRTGNARTKLPRRLKKRSNYAILFLSLSKSRVTFLKINVLSYLEASAARVPDRVCWADAASALTYREAWTAVCNMGAALSERLSAVNAPVCVLLRHDVTDLLAFFSVVYSGNFYVPIDPALPAVRLRSMLETLCPAAILTAGVGIDARADAGYPGHFSAGAARGSAIPSAAAPWKQRKDTDLLYVIFTSGSTGEPKGVSICHRSVIDMVEQFMRAFDFADGAVWGNQAPFDFDVSVKDIFLSLRVGGRLEILEKKLFSFPKLLLERLNERSVDTIIWAVPALKILARLHAFQTLAPAVSEKYHVLGRGHAAEDAAILDAGRPAGAVREPLWPDGDHLQLYLPYCAERGRGAAGGPDRQAVCQL